MDKHVYIYIYIIIILLLKSDIKDGNDLGCKVNHQQMQTLIFRMFKLTHGTKLIKLQHYRKRCYLGQRILRASHNLLYSVHGC